MRTFRVPAFVGAVLAAAAFTVAGAVAPTVHPVHRPSGRGQLVWTEPVRTLSPAATRDALHDAGFDSTAVTHGVRLYRLIYRTTDPRHRPTTASGLLALPVTPTRTLPTVLVEHGTVSFRGDAPSSLPADLFASAPALAYAGAGYAAAAPDYLGLGVGPGPHPWFDVASETSASVDFVHAASIAVAEHGHRLGRRLLVTGFSQGASAALAVARAIERTPHPHFRVAALAPISGGYAFGRVEIPALLDGRIPAPVAVPYVAYLLVAWQRLHHLYGDAGAVFRPPYADRVETLFDSEVPGPDMMRGLPASLDRLLTARGRHLLAHPTGRFDAALRAADAVCTWRRDVPVRLYYADGDEQALTANTSVCRHRLGASVRTVDLGTPEYAGSRHLGSDVAGVAATIDWFRGVVRPAALDR